MLALAYGADPGELAKVVSGIALLLLEDEDAGDIEDAERVAVGLGAIELRDALGPATAGDIDRHDIHFARQELLHHRRDDADIDVEAATRGVRNDEADGLVRIIGACRAQASRRD